MKESETMVYSEQDWPGADDITVVTEMLNDKDSHHWGACRSFVARQVEAMDVALDSKEEIVQEVMKSVVKALPGFRYRSRLTTWLIKVIRNKAIDILRYHLSRSSKEIPPRNTEEGDEEANTFEVVSPRETEDECVIRESLREAISALQIHIKQSKHPARDGIILRLSLLEDYTCEEIAVLLGVDSQTVYYIVRKARRHIRRAIK